MGEGELELFLPSPKDGRGAGGEGKDLSKIGMLPENWVLKQVISDLKLKNPQEQLYSKIPQIQTEVSLSPPLDTPLPDLKKMKRQPNKPKGVPKNNPLYKELLNLLSGNEEIAHRLIIRQQQLNPDKLENWILEKVVGDIKRDRRV